jgi:hypothetical protein
MPTAKDIFKKIDADVRELTTEVNALADKTRRLRSKMSAAETSLRSDLMAVVNLLMPVMSVGFLDARREYRTLIMKTLDDANADAEAAGRKMQAAEEDHRTEQKAFDLVVQQIETQLALRLEAIEVTKQAAEAKLNALLAAREAEDRVFRSEKFKLDNRLFLRAIHSNKYGTDGYEPEHFIFVLVGRTAAAVKRTRWYHQAMKTFDVATTVLARRDAAIQVVTAEKDGMVEQMEIARIAASKAVELKRGPSYGTAETHRYTQRVHDGEIKRLRLCQSAVSTFDQGEDQLMTDAINEFHARLVKDGPTNFIGEFEIASGDVQKTVLACHHSIVASQNDKVALSDSELTSGKAKSALDKLTKQRDKMKSKGWASSSKTIFDTKVNDYMSESSAFDLTDVMTIVLISDLISDNSSVFDTSVSDNSSWADTSSSSFDF